MPRLSRPIESLRPHYSAVVIGSGYGGGVAAARLARAGVQVAVLERGREFLPGDFPAVESGFMREVQVDTPAPGGGARLGSPLALFDVRVNGDISVLVGCGLGGTSLINANVCLRPEARVFADPCWPAPLRADVATRLADGYARAEAMLRPASYPEGAAQPAKLRTLLRASAAMGRPGVRLPIAVNFTEDREVAGLRQQACKLCGDCVTGCNHEAKNTVAATYLPDAHAHGAEIFTQVSVCRLERSGSQWLVYYDCPGVGRERFDAAAMFVRADLVIVAAGTLGSSELLLRSKDAGLRLSERVGARFSGNGDVIGFGFNQKDAVDAIGWGDRPYTPDTPIGPTLTGMIDAREQDRLEDGFIVQDGAIPGAIGRLCVGGLTAAAAAFGAGGPVDAAGQRAALGRGLASLVADDAYIGALRNTAAFIVTGHDDSGGSLYLDEGHLRVSWPDVGGSRGVGRINEALAKVVSSEGGTYVPNPLWSGLTTHSLVTVHPLGGCVMAESAEHGVVNHRGQVFSGARGDAVYDNLLVCDGSIVPRSLGANPLMTICALAERNLELLAEARGLTIAGGAAQAGPLAIHDEPTGVSFSEAMRGHFSVGETEDCARGEKQGEREGSVFEVVLTVFCRDLARIVRDPQHGAGMVGTVDAPALSSSALTISEGRFNLFVENPGADETRNLRYRMKMHSREGKTYYFSGVKVVHDDPGFDLWHDMTTLFSTIHDGDGPDAPVLGKGVIHVRLGDFLKQLASMHATGAQLTVEEQAEALAQFGKFFGYALLDTYGKVFAGGSHGPVPGS